MGKAAYALRSVDALLAKANLLRSHEVARVQPILDMQDIWRG